MRNHQLAEKEGLILEDFLILRLTEIFDERGALWTLLFSLSSSDLSSYLDFWVIGDRFSFNATLGRGAYDSLACSDTSWESSP